MRTLYSSVLAERTPLPSHPRRPGRLGRPQPKPYVPPPPPSYTPNLRWTPDQIEVLLDAVEMRPDRDRPSLAEFVEMGQSMQPPRHWRSCQGKWYEIEKRGGWRRQGNTVDAQHKLGAEIPPPPMTAPSSSPRAPSAGPCRLQDQRPPSPPPLPAEDVRALVSVEEQPFRAEDDSVMVKMNILWPGGAYKRIARSMNPPRHKADVRERLHEL